MRIEDAIGPRTRAIMLAHTLGNPFDLDAVADARRAARPLARRGQLRRARQPPTTARLTGTFGDLATASFYPAHHITMGEGGAVLTDRPQLKTIVESFRDWGRDCWCAPARTTPAASASTGSSAICRTGYDHKYIYSHIGYNLKVTDMQAAVGVAQLKKLPGFIEARQRNWRPPARGARSRSRNSWSCLQRRQRATRAGSALRSR